LTKKNLFFRFPAWQMLPGETEITGIFYIKNLFLLEKKLADVILHEISNECGRFSE